MFELSVNHPGRIVADLRLPPGMHSVVGSSGSGKTSLFRAISGMDRHPSFHATWNHRALAPFLPHSRPIAYVPQHPSLIPHRTVEEQVRFVAAPEALTDWQDWADALHLRDFLNRYPAQLSGGEQQRAALLRALATLKPILLLDEALSQIDRTHRMAIYERLRSRTDPNRLILFSTHQWDEVEHFSDYVVYLEASYVSWLGPASRMIPIGAAMAAAMGYIATVPSPTGNLLVHPRALAIGRGTGRGRFLPGSGFHQPHTPTVSRYHFVTEDSQVVLDWFGDFLGPAQQFNGITLLRPVTVSFTLPSFPEAPR